MTKKYSQYRELLICCLPFIVLAAFLVAHNTWQLRAKHVNMTVRNTTLTVEVADNSVKHARGLSGRKFLPANSGMLFEMKDNVQVFWMKGMRFPIDIVWIDSNKVVGWEKNVPVPADQHPDQIKKYYSPPGVDHVLELPAGDIERLKIKINDQVAF